MEDALKEVKGIFSTSGSFAALRRDGTVVTWGGCGDGGDSSKVEGELQKVAKIFSISSAAG